MSVKAGDVRIARTKIYLYGRLKKQFGGPFNWGVSDTKQAVRALFTMLPGFREEFTRNGAEYHFVRGPSLKRGTSLDLDMLDVNTAGNTLHIMPATKGSKNGGTLKVVVGVVVAAAAVVAAVPTGGGSIVAGLAAVDGAFGVTSLGAVAFFGLTMAVAGISQMISTQANKTDPNEDANNKTSYLFNGPVNVSSQGQAIPLVYGQMMVGSITVSSTYASHDVTSVTADDENTSAVNPGTSF